ncbi:hypothetical protein [Halpernia frigidisoli]|uniref:Uncharacterized protein n=1 Tax=Halpernia frigidisoli TaxID=1125876 RepID=A0A1I3HL73_9FLAO|nr:hypothetical protein [Halpernia frigidisoli]SFI36485.1 hypothetical protein SAMN05443292_2274 [Halpernia frigidisoli]
MISKIEENKIRDYLLDKKLPIDILLEVNDHFIIQIKTLEFEKDLSFDDAFKNVKENWRKDLTLSWAGGMDINDSNLLMRRISKNIVKDNIYFALKVTLFGMLFTILMSKFLPQNLFQYLICILVSAIFIYPLIIFIINFKKFNLTRKYDNYTLSLHQHNTALVLSLAVLPVNLIQQVLNHPENFNSFGNFKGFNLDFWNHAFPYLLLIVIFSLASLTIISQIKFLKQLEIVKPFLKYLKPS